MHWLKLEIKFPFNSVEVILLKYEEPYKFWGYFGWEKLWNFGKTHIKIVVKSRINVLKRISFFLYIKRNMFADKTTVKGNLIWNINELKMQHTTQITFDTCPVSEPRKFINLLCDELTSLLCSKHHWSRDIWKSIIMNNI